MKNIDLAIIRLSSCYSGRSCQKLMLKWIVENEDKELKIKWFSDNFGFTERACSGALRNLKREGFLFDKRRVGPNSFIYKCVNYKPKEKVVKKVKNTVSHLDWKLALGI